MFLPFILTSITIYLCALLAMAFFTLAERKALGYFQIRKGPNKVGLMGIPQPLADALKLFVKEQSKPSMANIIPFLIAPIMTLSLTLILWSIFPHLYPSMFMPLGILFFLSVSSLNVYTTLGAGWTSNSKYALLGAIRSVAQTISYEVSMIFIILPILIIFSSFDIFHINSQLNSWPLIMMSPLFLMWISSTLAETNRTPFDLPEGESELVSGFNIEYSSGSFALIFMAEYANILFMALLTSVLFLSTSSNLLLVTQTTMFAFLFIWTRASFPRIRYDQLMDLTWKMFLPCAILILLLVIPLVIF
uniref:NADH-ubiquinone oxidoreductase chain 1 n=3 Tax=Sternaspis TaxID=36132 RepID=A0A6C0UBV3_9ANNE|nr:NADH dehydrogenase subunit 1 [Sternaspis chinensis]YP_010580938.1 NADH dehydrogenase subunit 1 [Sternaspis liui]QIB72580.1 NADH dehydrogenase subunit 1 [Sternaspis scutata]UZT27136.1 NADH dehydrogenase subunit 1 [Sternaspis chinensis]UZT27149.1 NADH dehydrogenase subunit 1 [Sternaspis liui]